MNSIVDSYARCTKVLKQSNKMVFWDVNIFNLKALNKTTAVLFSITLNATTTSWCYIQYTKYTFFFNLKVVFVLKKKKKHIKTYLYFV